MLAISADRTLARRQSPDVMRRRRGRVPCLVSPFEPGDWRARAMRRHLHAPPTTPTLPIPSPAAAPAPAPAPTPALYVASARCKSRSVAAPHPHGSGHPECPLISKVIIIIFRKGDRAHPTLAPLPPHRPLPLHLSHSPLRSLQVPLLLPDGPTIVFLRDILQRFFSSFLLNFNLPAVGTCDLLSSDSDLGPSGPRFSACLHVAVVVTGGGGGGRGGSQGVSRVVDATLDQEEEGERGAREINRGRNGCR